MPDVKRTVKLITQQHIMYSYPRRDRYNPLLTSSSDKPSQVEGYPMRSWSIEIWLLNDRDEEVPATIFEKVTYELHPSFPKPRQTFKKPPFKIDEEGWGEFDMQITLSTLHRGGDHTVSHDLNFLQERYESRHVIVSLITLRVSI